MNGHTTQFWIVFCTCLSVVPSPGLTVGKSLEENIQFGGTVEVLCSDVESETNCLSGVVSMFRKVDIQLCVIQCKLPKICGFINYHFRMNICFLIRKTEQGETVSITTAPGYAFGDKTAWNMTLYENCKNCTEAEVCTGEPGLCQVEECHSQDYRTYTQAYSYAVGNVYNVGKKLAFRCEQSHMLVVYSSNTAVCLSNGTLLQPNYTCEEINECESNPCQNGGQCNDMINEYTCSCAGGWTGNNCDAEVNECESSPCLNGGQCTDMVNGYTCSCAGGWIGTNCETDINECESSPCLNGGQCEDKVNGYTCCCAGGWTGSSCETEINECESSPCQNGGQCNDIVDGYTCSCTDGWSGNRCQTDINECESSPCQSGGQCNDMVNGYSCSCAGGWTGNLCQTDINECESSPCQNGGLCNDLVNEYTCSCSGGWTGNRCQTDINECDSNPCLNGGQCDSIVNGCTCSCAEINECDSNPCQNGGQCNDNVNGYSCSCSGGWTGNRCQTEINECDSNPCLNGGQCNDNVNGYSCSCAAGWTGNRCQTEINECDSNPCQNGGQCNDNVNGYSCSCAAGWTGNRCQTAQCSSGWSIFQTSCYRLEATRKVFTSAKTECENLGGHLADVTSQAEMDFLEDLYLQSHSTSAVDGVWVSGNDRATEDKWVLSDGTSMTYYNWHAGQPDRQYATDDCMQVWPNSGFMWNDVYCDYGYWFYCEKEL